MVICNIFRKKHFKFDIEKFGFKAIGKFEEDYQKDLTFYKSGEVYTYYDAYYNSANQWIIKRCIDMGPATVGYETMDRFQKLDSIQSTIVYYGKIPNKRYGNKVMKNIGINDKENLNDTQ
jgi:hypothetical protein